MRNVTVFTFFLLGVMSVASAGIDGFYISCHDDPIPREEVAIPDVVYDSRWEHIETVHFGGFAHTFDSYRDNSRPSLGVALVISREFITSYGKDNIFATGIIWQVGDKIYSTELNNKAAPVCADPLYYGYTRLDLNMFMHFLKDGSFGKKRLRS